MDAPTKPNSSPMTTKMELTASIDVIKSLTAQFDEEFAKAGLDIANVQWTRAYAI